MSDFLNPIARKSGVTYEAVHNLAHFFGHRSPTLKLAENSKLQMQDLTVGEYIEYAFKEECSLYRSFQHTYAAIVGCHYDFYLNGAVSGFGGHKGALDFLILPLIARKLLATAFMNEHNQVINTLALLAALPIEITRIALGMIVTMLLTPVVIIVHLLKPSASPPPGSPGASAIALENAASPIIGLLPTPREIEAALLEAILQNREVLLQEPAQHAYTEDEVRYLEAKLPELVCPITMELIREPVFIKAHSQQCFEKSALMNHLMYSKTNPLTREPLTAADLWCKENAAAEATQLFEAFDTKIAEAMSTYNVKQQTHEEQTEKPQEQIFCMC